MKTIIALLTTISAIANTYYLSNPVSSEASYDYKPLETITLSNVELLVSDIYTREVTFKANLNGKLGSFSGKIVDRKVNNETKEYTYKVQGTLASKQTANGYGCDEFESFSYVYTGELEVQYEVRVKSFKVTELALIKKYNWDICHDSTETTVTPYILK